MKNTATLLAGAVLGWTIFEQALSFRNIHNAFNTAETRDASRSGYKSFGLNYGFTTDRAIEELLDTGDLLLVQCNCWQLLAEKQIRLCFLRKVMQKARVYLGTGYKSEEDWDSVALVYRDKEGVTVLSDFQGVKSAYSYDDFLSLPYVQAVKLRKLTTSKPQHGFVEGSFIPKALARTSAAWLISQDGVDIVKMYLRETGLSTCEGFSTVEEMEREKLVEAEMGKYGVGIIVRTEDSKKETKNY